MERKHLTFVLPSLGQGGAERVISVLTNELISMGYQIDIVMISNRHQSYSVSEKAKVYYLDCDEDQSLNVLKRYIRRLHKIKRVISSIKPDIVVSFMAETNIDVCIALATLHIPIIVSERNDPKNDPKNKIKQILRSIVYKKPRGFVFQTEDAKAYFPIKIQNKSKIILNPLSESLPLPWEGKREFRIVAVGRLNAQKNFILLINAFKEFVSLFPEFILEIYGDGKDKDILKNYIEKNNLQGKVLLKGFCKDVHSHIVNAAMFVMSSDFEGMPNALLEAMAIGLPCISTDCPCGGPRMLIKNNHNGLLVPVNDEKALINAMATLAGEKDFAAVLGKNASLIKEEVSSGKIAQQWCDFICESIGKD